MNAFDPVPPQWTTTAIHAHGFCCPACGALSIAAERVWLNRGSPVFTEDHRKKWQEFYYCACDQAWWAWSTDRPNSTNWSVGLGNLLGSTTLLLPDGYSNGWISILQPSTLSPSPRMGEGVRGWGKPGNSGILSTPTAIGLNSFLKFLSNSPLSCLPLS